MFQEDAALHDLTKSRRHRFYLERTIFLAALHLKVAIRGGSVPLIFSSTIRSAKEAQILQYMVVEKISATEPRRVPKHRALDQ